MITKITEILADQEHRELYGFGLKKDEMVQNNALDQKIYEKD